MSRFLVFRVNDTTDALLIVYTACRVLRVFYDDSILRLQFSQTKPWARHTDWSQRLLQKIGR
jgi:hypothetical protein